jgi:hypothetical protein
VGAVMSDFVCGGYVGFTIAALFAVVLRPELAIYFVAPFFAMLAILIFKKVQDL